MITPVQIALFCVFSFVAAFVLTAAVRRWASNLNLVQHANLRSSHVSPTPTGGGASFALIAVIFGGFLSIFEPSLLSLVLFCTVLSLVGLADDLFELSARLRLLIQLACVATILILFVTSGMQILGLTGILVLFALIVVSVFCLWWVNLVNFMDGIDGLVGTQAVAILMGGTVLKLMLLDVSISHFDVWVLVTAFAIGGFLLLNFPPAKIFMGDAGSYFIASFVLIIVLDTAISSPNMIVVWLVLSAPLICDATATILVRLLRGERWYAAHRQHAYQHLSRKLGSHRLATFAYLAQFCLISIPAAIVSLTVPQFSYLVGALAFMVLAALAIRNKAGQRDA